MIVYEYEWIVEVFSNKFIERIVGELLLLIEEIHARAKRARGRSPIAKEIYPSQKIW